MVDDTYDNDSSLWWPLIDARNVGRVDGFLDNYLDPRQDLRNLQGEYLVVGKTTKSAVLAEMPAGGPYRQNCCTFGRDQTAFKSFPVLADAVFCHTQ